jgi:hypothetical protein
MSNIFQEVLTDSQGVENALLGPTYPYYQNIKSPQQIGMGTDGTINQLSSDINGLTDYVKLLVSGNTSASTTGGPLGNKFFLQTGAKCSPVTCPSDSSNCQVDRYIYIDNVPDGSIPFISSAMGTDFSDFKGLIPGALSDLSVLNPYGILTAFATGTLPSCQEITMETIDNFNNVSSETNYVTVSDISNMDPCIFSNGINPITTAKCTEAFNNNKYYHDKTTYVMSNDLLQLFYLICLSIIGIYILYCIMQKSV